MSADLMRRVRETFEACILESSPQQRERLLTLRCSGDHELEVSVRHLLEVHASADDFLENPLVGLLDDGADCRDATTKGLEVTGNPDFAITEDLPMIGPYKLREQIGEGGFGLVFMAEQAKPVRRKVAIKLIKPGMDTRQIIARFEAERQSLAMLDHPNIAKIFDGGTTEQGRPYFAMELVPGVPITQYCDQVRMGIRERIDLFLSVCKAVQHAHQKGIIHRDIKPSNVLVAMHDDKPVVKVIDFGVAKALNQRLTDKSIYTSLGQMIGTPMYMSPEQAHMNVMDVDTRSDIYSLGVLLYELLAGTTPFDLETLKRVGVDSLRQMICDTEPPRPSLRVSTLTAEATKTVADRRQVDEHCLKDSLHGELDWIVMRALEKDRNRRYETVNGLAEDLHRYLNNEPVLACPPTAVYRIQKFISRNKGIITTLALIAVALNLGLVIAAWQTLRAWRAESQALVERDRALESEAENQTLLYVADMRRAENAWVDRDVTRLHRILETLTPEPDAADLRGFEWHYLKRQSSQLKQELFQGFGPVYFLVPLPGGEVAAAGADGAIRFFDIATASLVRSIHPDQGELNGLSVTSDGQFLGSAGDDGTIALWELASGRQKWRVKGHEKQVFQIGFTPDDRSLVSAANEANAKVWDIETGAQLATLDTDSTQLETLSVSAQGAIALGTNWGGVWFFRSIDADGICLREQPGRSQVRFSHSGELLAIGFATGEITILLADHSKQAVCQWSLPDAPHSMAFSPDDRWLAVGDSSGAVHLLPVPGLSGGPNPQGQRIGDSSAAITSWHAHEGRAYAVAFVDEGRSVVTGGRDGRIALWRDSKPTEPPHELNHVVDVQFLDPGRIVWSTESRLHLTNLALQPVGSVPDEGRWNTIAVAKDSGRTCATQREHAQIYEVDPRNHTVSVIWTVDPLAIYRASALSPDGRTLVVTAELPQAETSEGGTQRFLEIVDLENHRRLARIPARSAFNIAFSPEGDYFAFDSSNEIHLVDSRTWQVTHRIAEHTSTVNRLAWSPDGSTLASVSSDRTLRTWSPLTGQQLWNTVAHRNRAKALAFSPDGQTLATVGDDGYLRLWKWLVKRLALRIPVRLLEVKHLRFSPDGKQLIVVYTNGEFDLIEG